MLIWPINNTKGGGYIKRSHMIMMILMEAKGSEKQKIMVPRFMETTFLIYILNFVWNIMYLYSFNRNVSLCPNA